MKFNTTVTIHLDEQENMAWNTLYKAISKLTHEPCEDVGAAEAVNDFYEAMMNLSDYLDDD